MSKAVRELAILVGMPGAGKTTYCEQALEDYERISQDDGPHSYPGVLRKLEELIVRGAPLIVIDRTNPRRYQRDEFASRGRAAEYRIRIIYFDVAVETCRERILKRAGHPTLAPDRMLAALARYSQDLNLPSPEECDELVILH